LCLHVGHLLLLGRLLLGRSLLLGKLHLLTVSDLSRYGGSSPGDYGRAGCGPE